jgi:hypothetical protein
MWGRNKSTRIYVWNVAILKKPDLELNLWGKNKRNKKTVTETSFIYSISRSVLLGNKNKCKSLAVGYILQWTSFLTEKNTFFRYDFMLQNNSNISHFFFRAETIRTYLEAKAKTNLWHSPFTGFPNLEMDVADVCHKTKAYWASQSLSWCKFDSALIFQRSHSVMPNNME